ncbi:MAG TPA: hypothetical protein VJJ98_10615 [Sedimentisphaerales bacterium]|nr:hypothetical protein [Sedimentisphaerales bacterium]
MPKKLSFVVFKDVRRRFTSNFISINKQGGFAFNAGFYRKNDLKHYSHVVLSYDAANKAVGFQFAAAGKKMPGWKLTHVANSGNVIARSFFNGWGLDPVALAGRYEPTEYTDPKLGKLFYIVLRKPDHSNQV